MLEYESYLARYSHLLCNRHLKVAPNIDFIKHITVLRSELFPRKTTPDLQRCEALTIH